MGKNKGKGNRFKQKTYEEGDTLKKIELLAEKKGLQIWQININDIESSEGEKSEGENQSDLSDNENNKSDNSLVNNKHIDQVKEERKNDIINNNSNNNKEDQDDEEVITTLIDTHLSLSKDNIDEKLTADKGEEQSFDKNGTLKIIFNNTVIILIIK